MQRLQFKNRVLDHDGIAPRYTSYPPAPQFMADFPQENLVSWLKSLAAPQTLSLYIHIPFCAKLCYYCGCHTSIANQYDRIAEYLVQLRREIDRTACLVSPGIHVTHLHFGGGSPTMLNDMDFTALMAHLRNAFYIAPDAEIAIEADPRQLTQEKINNYARCGVTRLSLGVQDFDETVLRVVNREQPQELTENAIRWTRAAGISGINIDIMYGLPHQTLATQAVTLEKVIALSPDRIAFFGYAHVPWMKKHMNVIGQEHLPDVNLRYDLFNAGKNMLTKAGYHAIGIDHFVRGHDSMYRAWRGGTLKRNFQGYTTDHAYALLGLGASAISAFPEGYSQNFTDLRAYADAIQTGMMPVSRGIATTGNDRARADVIMRLMCDLGVNLAHVAHMHGMPIDSFDEACAGLASLITDGLVELNGRRLTIHPDAPQIARIAAQAFDAYAATQSAPGRHSRAI